MRYITGALIASLALIALHLWGADLLGKILDRGNDTKWGDVAKQADYRYWNGGVEVAQNPR